MVAEGNDDEIEDVVIPTIPDAVGPMVSQGLSNLGFIPTVNLLASTTANAQEQVVDLPISTTASVVLYCTYSTYVPYSLSPYRVLNSDTASAFTSISRHIVISPLYS